MQLNELEEMELNLEKEKIKFLELHGWKFVKLGHGSITKNFVWVYLNNNHLIQCLTVSEALQYHKNQIESGGYLL